MKTIFAFLIMIFTFSAYASGEILLISDIDDTIKESHVLSDFDKIGKAFSAPEFPGMSDLYQSIQKANPGIEFHYVTNAPDFLMKKSHQNFLMNNKFPYGQVHLSPSIDSTGHKFQVISNLIETRQPHTVIMIGDNGEKDVFVHDEIAQRYADLGIQFIQFIRVAYNQHEGGKLLLQGQTGFVTAGEIALVLMENNLLNPVQAKMAIQSSINKGYLQLPNWLDCTDLHLSMTRFMEFSPLVKKLDQQIRYRCQLTFPIKKPLIERLF